MVKPENIDQPDTDDAEPAKQKSGPGVVLIGVATVIAATASGGAAYFLTPGGESTAIANADANKNRDEHDEASTNVDASHDVKKSAHNKPKGKHEKSGPPTVSGGDFQIIGEAAFFELHPLVITIDPIGRSRHLKVGLVIETTPQYAPVLAARAHHIRDVFNTYLRSVDAAEFEDPAAMSRLRAQLLRRTRTVAPDAHVRSVLITEFILT